MKEISDKPGRLFFSVQQRNLEQLGMKIKFGTKIWEDGVYVEGLLKM